MHEIIQPSLQKPDLSDPVSWATISRIHSDWLKSVAPQLGLDINAIMLGDVLSSIVGDDVGAIGAENVILDPDNPEYLNAAQQMLSERLDWEVSVHELPEDIREKACEVLALLTTVKWVDEETFREAKNTWLSFKAYVQDRINTDPALSSAIQYDFKASALLSPYWEQFLFGTSQK